MSNLLPNTRPRFASPLALLLQLESELDRILQQSVVSLLIGGIAGHLSLPSGFVDYSVLQSLATSLLQSFASECHARASATGLAF
jgi:hypothetical protein